MDELLAQIKSLAQAADDSTRRTIQTSLRDLSHSLESAEDLNNRIWGLPVQSCTIYTAIELSIFDILCHSATPLSIPQLATATHADPLLLSRLLRSLASFGFVRETGQDEYSSNTSTKHFTGVAAQANIRHNFEVCGPVFQALPGHLKRTGYKNIEDSKHSPFQDGHATKMSAFEWMVTQPRLWQNFNVLMSERRKAQTTWLDVYPLTTDATGLSDERALFVDVGGNIGHSCAEFRAKYPDLPGEIILQDLPFVIQMALKTPGVINMPHDFTTPEPVRGAKFYYMRAVLHDWPEEKCKVILRHVIDAMAEDSILLLDDAVVPDVGINWEIAQIDLTMMATMGGMERTVALWDAIFADVGLRIVRRLVYTPALNETVTALAKK